MKNFIIVVALLAIVSCTSNFNEDFQVSDVESVELVLESSLSEEIYGDIYSQLDHEVNTRAVLNDDSLYKQLLTPMIDDGKKIQNQIVLQLQDTEVEEIEYIENLTEEELVALSFVVYNLNKISDEKLVGGDITSQRIRDCLGFATGVTAIKQLSIKGCVNAVTVRQAIIAVGKRYLGYVGLALLILDFADCING